MKLSIGIDPGLSGGVAFVPESGIPWAHKMPETDRNDHPTIHGLKLKLEESKNGFELSA